MDQIDFNALRRLRVVLGVSLAFALCACGGSASVSSQDQGSSVASGTNAATPTTQGPAGSPPNGPATAVSLSFPLLGAALIANPKDYDQEESQIAEMSVAVLGMSPGWRGSNGQTSQQVLAAIKAKNPNIRIFLYNIINEVPRPIPTSVAYVELSSIASVPWFLTTYETTGSLVPSGDGEWQINTTTYAKTDSSGVKYLAWRASRDVTELITPNPSADGMFIDGFGWAPLVDGDWTLSGTVQSKTNPTTQQIYRLGYAAYVGRLKALLPAGKYLAGNTSTWGQSNHTITEYEGLVQGGVMEGMIGESWSYETWGGWATMLGAYQKVMAATAAPQYQIFMQDGPATDYQGFRYGFASCLVGGNAYFAYNLSEVYNAVNIFDEYSARLGTAISGPQTHPWQNGVWRRDFANGIALVNPRGNGAQTVTLEASYKHLSGTQDPSVNNGATVTKVALNDRDGVILLRTTAAAAPPEAPSSLTVH
jgi:hypothetical protein